MEVLLLVDAWLIGMLVVLVIESELVKCGSSSFWHAPESPKISIAREGIKVLHNRYTQLLSFSDLEEWLYFWCPGMHS